MLGEEQHPSVQPAEKLEDYLARTEQYWIELARSNMGPEAKEKKVVKVAHAMAKTVYKDSEARPRVEEHAGSRL